MDKDKLMGIRDVLGWRGLLAQEDRRARAIIFVTQAILSVALTFTQLGFASVEFDNDNYFYLLTLLVPIAIVPMLLGVATGTAFGFVAGLLLMLHSSVLPSNYYEFVLVTPATSIGLLALCAFVQGCLYAWLLPKRATLMRQTLLVGIACIAVSWICSMGFALYSAFLTRQGILSGFLGDLVLSANGRLNGGDAPVMGVALLGISTQAWLDALLMAAASETFYHALIKVRRMKEGVGLRALFGVWLLNTIAGMSMVAVVLSYVSMSLYLLQKAEHDMRDEVAFLRMQIDEMGDRVDAFIALYESLDVDKLTEEQVESVMRLSTPYDSLLQGYTPSADGIVFIMVEGTVYMTDSALFPVGVSIDSLVGEDVLDTIEQSATSSTIKRVFLAGGGDGSKDAEAHGKAMQMAYVYAEQIDDYAIVMIQPSSMVFADRFGAIIEVFVGIGIVSVTVYLIVFYLLRQIVAQHLDKTNEVLASITAGDLGARLDVEGAREFRRLNAGINTTVDALNGWIQEAETRMDSELSAARAIQESALPREFPPFPNITRFDVFASMDPAKEVGGDFYDFFLMDNANEQAGKLCFMIADVSDKGVPAALFMMKAKALLHENMERGASLSQAVEHANAQLCEGNPSFMFVTAWIGVLDYGARRVEYVNAGHNPPLMRHAKKNTWEWLEEAAGPPLGLANMPYPSDSFACETGDLVLLYTDGVTEAQNASQELYGEDRLKAVLQKMDDQSLQEVVDAVRLDVARFYAGADQADDITMVALKMT